MSYEIDGRPWQCSKCSSQDISTPIDNETDGCKCNSCGHFKSNVASIIRTTPEVEIALGIPNPKPYVEF